MKKFDYISAALERKKSADAMWDRMFENVEKADRETILSAMCACNAADRELINRMQMERARLLKSPNWD